MTGDKNKLPPMPYAKRADFLKPKESTTIYPDGSFVIEGSPSEMIQQYYQLAEIIGRGGDIHARINACEETYKFLRLFVKSELQQCGKLPDSIPCRDYGAKLYMWLGQWKNAKSAIKKCARAGVYEDNGQAELDYLQRYQQTAKIAVNFLRTNEGFLQKNIYKALANTDADSACLKDFVRSTRLIDKVKAGNSNQLFLNIDALAQSDFSNRMETTNGDF